MGKCFSKYRLMKLDAKNVENFTLANKRHLIRICDVYDGDTVTGIIRFKGEFYKFKIRMEGYDSPELKTSPLNPNGPVVLETAIAAREFLKSIIYNKVVEGSCSGYDKYGRLLMTIYYKGMNVNKHMIDKGHGYPYKGGSKKDIVKNDPF